MTTTRFACTPRQFTLGDAVAYLPFLKDRAVEKRFDLSAFAWAPLNDMPCWLWTGWTDEKGYGRVRWGEQRSARVHRVTFETLRYPTELVIDHLCRVRHCCNPWHGQPVTLAQNTLRGARADGICRNGLHAMEGDNVIERWRDGSVRYECRQCKAERR
jgi:hypothetical protein